MSKINPVQLGLNHISANVTEGVIERLKTYFLRYPNSRPKYACISLHLDPKHYGATARVVKSRVRKAWGGANIQADTLEALTSLHRQVWYLQGGVPAGPVLSAFLDIARNGCNRDNTWFFSNNQNRQLNFRSDKLAIRILPSTRRLEILCRTQGINGMEVRKEFERILYSTLTNRLPPDHDALCIARDLSLKIVPKERHRRFVFPPGPYYKLRFYENSLGLILQHDLSESMNEQEAIEKIPPWIRDLIQVVIRLGDKQRETNMILQRLEDAIWHSQLIVNENAGTVTANEGK